MEDKSTLGCNEVDINSQSFLSKEAVVQNIENKVQEIVAALDRGVLPNEHGFETTAAGLKFRKCTFETMTNMLLVLCYIHNLLLNNKTSTTREVFYFYVTHFKSKRECDQAIQDVAQWLNVPRVALGLVASPKGISVLLMILFFNCVI